MAPTCVMQRTEKEKLNCYTRKDRDRELYFMDVEMTRRSIHETLERQESRVTFYMMSVDGPGYSAMGWVWDAPDLSGE